jgi:hypothetical protein
MNRYFVWYGHFRRSAHIICATRWNIHERDYAEWELVSLLSNKTLQSGGGRRIRIRITEEKEARLVEGGVEIEGKKDKEKGEEN